MKNLYILLLSTCFCFTSFSQMTFCDDFEAYSNGDPIAETSPKWNTWGELMPPYTTAPFVDDANVVNNLSFSGSNALYLNDATGSGGPQDLVLMFDTTSNIINTTTLSTPHTFGVLDFSQMMYVMPGKTGYFNFQAENQPGLSWALEVNLDANGGIAMSNTNGTTFNCTYPGPGTWFEISFNIDLSNNIWEVFIDSVSQGSFSNSINQISSLDLYPGVASEYYVDNICYSYDTTPIVLPNLDLAVSNINTISGLSGQDRDVTVEVINLGLNPITSFDISFLYNGNTISDNITGVLLLTGTSNSITLSNPIYLVGGTYTGTATVSNVNNMPFDDNPSNDQSSTQITAITPADNKLVIGEEATGTWCGWCPRGAVALNFMDRDYHGYFQGIAVHNGDPMANTDYDTGLYGFHGGSFPSAAIDREMMPIDPMTGNPDAIDPSEFEQYFLQKIIIPPSAKIINGAQQNGLTLEVSLDVDVIANINGSWSLACALVEDSVTGTGGTWYQSNSYSGNISLIDVNGVDWMNLPNWVPDVQMVYRHVARAIAPTFNGESLDNTSYTVGETFTKCFTFTLDPSWDLTKMHVVGMLIKSNGEIDNASSTSVAEAIGNGYSSSCNTTSMSNALFSPDKELVLYPNPTNSITTLRINLESAKSISISIQSIDGKMIASRDYGVMAGPYSLDLDFSHLSNGIYFIEAMIGNRIIREKIIKN